MNNKTEKIQIETLKERRQRVGLSEHCVRKFGSPTRLNKWENKEHESFHIIEYYHFLECQDVEYIKENLEVIQVQIFVPFKYLRYFSANVAVKFSDDREAMLQIGNDSQFSIPASAEAIWSDEKKQDYFSEFFEPNLVAEALKIPVEMKQLEARFLCFKY